MSARALRALGLGATAEAVYRAMLAEPTLGVVELAERLSLSEFTVRKGLAELARLTLLRESLDAPGQWRPVQPELGLEAIIRRQEEDLAKRQQALAASKARMAEAMVEFSALQVKVPGEETHQLVGLDAIHTRLEVLAKRTTFECLSVVPRDAQSRANLDAFRSLDHAALNRGVKLFTLYQNSIRNDLLTYAYARRLTELGGQVRTAPILPPRMLIFDRRTVVIPIETTNNKLGAMCTESAIVTSLIAIFNQAWTTATPLEAGIKSAAVEGVTDSERALLRLLATGLTDEAAGRRLGTSARTVRRQVAALMDRLGASSRFEAGFKAMQCGWV